jgi:voltage-gated sodium channel
VALTFDWINFVFTVIFLIEAMLKISAYKNLYFRDSWNRFDFAIVVISIIDFILTFFVTT